MKEITYPGTIFTNADGFIHQQPFLRKYLQMDPSYDSLLKKYDFKKGIFVHMRYGDKVTINYTTYTHKKGYIYTLLNGAYYIDAIKKLSTPGAPIYIFSDSIAIARYFLDGKVDATFVKEGTYETYYCFTKCHNLIASRSTMSLAAIYLNYNKDVNIIAPGYPEFYDYSSRTYKNVTFKYPSHVTVEKDKSYILTDLQDYKKIIPLL
jgi:hypothetical protein